MARIRSVKPEICTSETLARCSAEVERTFVRLWTHCDDHGRAKDHPRLIAAALFPLHDDVTPADVDAHLDRLWDLGLIVRYEADGGRWLAVPSWNEHQHPQRPGKSTIPPAPDPLPVRVRVDACTPPGAVAEVSWPVVEGRGEVEVVGEVEVAGSSPALRGTQVAADPANDTDASRGERVVLDGDAREQAIRRTAALVGRAVASAADADDPAAYAAGVTKRILAGDDERIGTIGRLIDEGHTPEVIVRTWEITSPDGWDPLTGDGGPRQSPSPGPDALGHYAAKDEARRAQMADQEAAPVAVVKSLAAESRRNLGKAVPA